MNQVQQSDNNGKIDDNVDGIDQNKNQNYQNMENSRQKNICKLKIGDIIYFTYQADIKLEYDQLAKGVVIGDGISSEKLQCVPKNILCRNNGDINFRKSLFQIEKSKKYTAKKEYEEYQEKNRNRNMNQIVNQNSINFNRSQVQKGDIEMANQSVFNKSQINKNIIQKQQQVNSEEKNLQNLYDKLIQEQLNNQDEYESSKGEFITYGEEIQLKHVYSKCYLTLKQEQLAEQNGCVKITLEQQGDEYSNFKFIPNNNLNAVGKRIQYTDKVILSTSIDDLYYVHISEDAFKRVNGQSNNTELFMKGLEVNASEISTQMKINCYVEITELKQQESIGQNYLRNGELVYLYSKELDAKLMVKYQQLQKYKQIIDIENDGQKYQMKCILEDQIIEDQNGLDIYVEQDQEQKRYQINSIWEIQKSYTFNGSLPKDTDYFRIKNLSTGLYLCTDDNDMNQLSLTNNGSKQECRFTFKLKKQNQEEDKYIPYYESLNIKTYNDKFISIKRNQIDNYDSLISNYENMKNIQDINKLDYNQMKVMCSSKTDNYSNSLFELRQINQETKLVGDRVCSLQIYLLQFLFFLQEYGVRKEDDKLIYDFKKALNQERLLDSEVQQLFQSMNKINQFLNGSQKQSDDKSLKLKQYSLKDMQILDLLLQIAKTMDWLINLNQNQNYQQCLKIRDILQRKQMKVINQDNTPQYLAYLHLEQILQQVYEMIYKMVQHNRRNSEFIIQKEHFDFLLSQNYNKIVKQIMTEAIKESEDTNDVRLEEWIEILQPLHKLCRSNEQSSNQNINQSDIPIQQIEEEDEDNNCNYNHQFKEVGSGLERRMDGDDIINEQLFCLEIISSTLRRGNNPLKSKQDKLRKCLFKNKEDDDLLLQFDIQQDNPIIIFKSNYNPQEDIQFYNNYKMLDNFSNRPDSRNQISFYINDFVDNDYNMNYVKYISRFIDLLGYVCDGRNEKSIEMIEKQFHISHRFMMKVLSHDIINLNDNSLIMNRNNNKNRASIFIMNSIRKLYLYTQLDLDPLKSISQLNNRTIIYEQIKYIHHENPCYQLFGKIFSDNLNNHKKYILTNFNTFMPLLNSYWNEGMNELHINQQQSHNEYDRENLREQLRCLIGLLQLTRIVIDLGYTNQKFNQSILQHVSLTFEFVFCNEMNQNVNQNSFLLDYILSLKEYFQQNQQYEIYYEQYLVSLVIQELLKIQEIIKTIELTHKYYDFIRLISDIKNNEIQKCIDSNKSLKKHEEQQKVMKSIFENVYVDSKKDRKMICDQFKLMVDYQVVENEVNLYVMTPNLRKDIYNQFDTFLSQNQYLSQQIIQIILIKQQKEIDLYITFGGFALNSKDDNQIIINPMILKNQIKYLIQKNQKYNDLFDQLNTSNNRNSIIQGLQKIKIGNSKNINMLNAMIEKTILKLEELYSKNDQKSLFKTGQEILRNLDIHNIIVQVFSLEIKDQSYCQQYRTLFQNCIEFLELFAIDNNQNQQQLIKYFYSLIKMGYQNISIKRLFSIIFCHLKENHQQISTYINDLIKLLDQNSIINNFYNCNEIISILLSLVRNKQKKPILKNQQLILAKLLKIVQLTSFQKSESQNQFILNVIQPIQQTKQQMDFKNYEYYLKFNLDNNYEDLIDVMNQIKESQQYNQLKVYLNTLNLIGNCSDQYDLGCQQIKKILTFEQIKLYLNDNQFFIAKKYYLRVLYQVYISQMNSNNNDFKLTDIVEIFEKVLNDLQVYAHYIGGIIDIQQQDEEKIRIALNTRSKIRENVKNIGLQLVQKEQMIQQQKDSQKHQNILFDEREYWDYLSGGELFDNSNDGLLNFIIDCIQIYKEKGWNKVDMDYNYQLINLFKKIKQIVTNIQKSIIKIEIEKDKNCQQNFQSINLLINSIINIVNDDKNINQRQIQLDQQEDLQIVDQQNMSEDYENDMLVNKIRLFIIQSKINTEQFFRIFEYQQDLIPMKKYEKDLLELLSSNSRFGNLELDLEMDLGQIDNRKVIDINREFKQHIERMNVIMPQNDKNGDRLIKFSALQYKLQTILEYSNKNQQQQINQDICKRLQDSSQLLEEEKSMRQKDLQLESYKLMFLEFSWIPKQNKKIKSFLKQIKSDFESSYKQKKDKEKKEQKESIDQNTKIINEFEEQQNQEMSQQFELVKYKTQFLQKFIVMFGKHEDIINFLKIIKVFLQDDIDETEEMIRKLKDKQESMSNIDYMKLYDNLMTQIVNIQNQYHDSGVTQLALGFLKENNDEKLAYESINILNMILQGGNKNIQEQILSILQKNQNKIKYEILNYLKIKINQFQIQIQSNGKALDNIQDSIEFHEQRSKIRKQDLINQLLKFLQMLCENCNNDFQNFLRSQQNQFENENEQLLRVDIVQETADLLSCLHFDKEQHSWFFINKKIDLQRFYMFDPNSENKLNLNIENQEQLEIQFNKIVEQCFMTLTDFCVGPCNQNQRILCQNKKLIIYINDKILSQNYDFSIESDNSSVNNENAQIKSKFNQKKIGVLQSCIKYLQIITIGNQDEEIMKIVIEKLMLNKLIEIMTKIYVEVISKQEDNIITNKISNHQKVDQIKTVIEIGFNIYILFQFFIDIFPDKNVWLEKLKIIKKKRLDEYLKYYNEEKGNKEQNKQKNDNQNDKKMNNDNEKWISELLSNEDLNQEEQQLISKNKDIESRNTINSMNNDKLNKQGQEGFRRTSSDFYNSCKFYNKFVGSVEIAKRTQTSQKISLHKLYYQKEFISNYVTKNTKQNIIYQVNQQSDQERINNFYNNVNNYRVEMVYYQYLSSFHQSINFLIKHWIDLKDFSYILVVLINLMNIITFYYDKNTKTYYENTSKLFGSADKQVSQNIYYGITYIQITLQLLVFLFCMTERYKVSLTKSFINNTQISMNEYKQQSGQSVNELKFYNRQLMKLSQQPQSNSYFHILIKILLDFQNIINLSILIISMLTLQYRSLYSVLLLDIIFRMDDLKNIFRSLYINGMTLIQTFILNLILIYILSTYAFINLSEFYVTSDNAYLLKTNLMTIFFSTLNYGLRSPGGIGDQLESVAYDHPKYFTMYAFQIVFFIVVNILLINIFFGIIIDSFGELRDKKKNQEKEINGKCYICGISNSVFDNDGNGWLKHIYLEHNLYNYLHFIIYIENKDSNECNGLEKYVKDLIKNKSHSFIPIQQSLCLKNKPRNFS